MYLHVKCGLEFMFVFSLVVLLIWLSIFHFFKVMGREYFYSIQRKLSKIFCLIVFISKNLNLKFTLIVILFE